MILIAHRGNISGPTDQENDPRYVDVALAQGYDAEIDLWIVNNKFFLGHDSPQYEVHFEYLTQKGLWIHCKHHEALTALHSTKLNFFYHTNEDYVLTSHRYIWAYPGKPGSKYTICVLPEWNNTPIDGFAGVCSDYVERYNDKTNSL
jgi:hypothetical protein